MSFQDPVVLSIVDRLQREPELAGAMIGFEGDGYSRVISFGTPGRAPSVCIVIEKICEKAPAVREELQAVASQPDARANKALLPAIITNRSRLYPELVGAGISCGLTVVSALGVVSGAAAEVPTGGASTFLIIAAWTGVVTGGVQCINGLVRVAAIAAAPNENSLQRWDSNSVYSTVILIVDAVGIAAGAGSLPFGVRNLWAVLARQRAFVAKGLTFESLKAMNRAERLRVITQVFEEAGKTPEGREALLQAARAAGTSAPGASTRAGMSVAAAVKVGRTISEETARRLTASLRDVTTSLAAIGASATPAYLTGSASGSINYLINIIDVSDR